METVTKQLYEGMFLIDVARAGSDWDGIIATITKILEKSEAEIVSIRKWDDRKLAYNIKGQSRGVYILCYFRVDGRKMQEIEKSLRLSEQIMRILILNAELLTQEDIEKDTPALKAEKEGIKTSDVFSDEKDESLEVEHDLKVEEHEIEPEDEFSEIDESDLGSNTDEQV
ncbi:MAG: 30S ribosomal protein S6 [Sedimentisphaerales bacterium]|nr:30S ribosomal protein S6 [Sedimentisphaerales bacterium]